MWSVGDDQADDQFAGGSNQAGLIAYTLGNFWPRLVMPKLFDNWSLTSLQRLAKTGGRLVKHARSY
jgi:hypothetical protein